MKVAIVYSQYSEIVPSGESLVVARQLNALKKKGHEVRLFVKKTDDERKKVFFHVRAAYTVAFGRGSSMLDQVLAFKPDIIHIHNLFPNLGWTWLHRVNAPIVVTLHNYRTFCAVGTALLDGKSCLLCPTKGSHNAVRNKCYRGSSLATIPLAIQTRNPPVDHPLLKLAEGIVFLSTEMRNVFISLGIGEKLERVIPNFVPSNSKIPEKKNGRWIWVGRFSQEKGLTKLLRVWPEGHYLDVFGEGPLQSELMEIRASGVTFHGLQTSEKLRKMMPKYLGMIVSSEMPGNSVGLVHLEAMAAGLPVVALRGSSSAAEVESTGHGSTYASKEELRDALVSWESGASVSQEILKRFESEYSEEVWVKRTIAFYNEVLKATVE